MVNFYKPKAVKKQQNRLITVEINSLDINGDGVSRIGKKPVFISGALPGEKVEAKVSEEKSKYLRARAIKIYQQSEQRVEPKCRHFYQCGGCDLQHMSSDAQIAYKQKKVATLFSRNADLNDLPWQAPLISEQWNYRRKARIGVQYNKLNQTTIGFRQKGSNVLTPVKSCHLLPSIFADEFSAFHELLDNFTSHRAISHIEIIDAERPAVIFRQVAKLTAHDLALLEKFSTSKDYQLLLQTDNAIVDLNKQKPGLFSYDICGSQLQFSESDFVQVNSHLNIAMVEQAIDYLQLEASDTVLDLFCGLGNFSIPMAKMVNKVIGVEGVQAMVDRAQSNAQLNQLSNCEFLQADLNVEKDRFDWLNSDIDKVLLDPARAGAFNAVKNIVELNVNLILYISCDPATMTRDAKILFEHGYKLEKLSLMDMFSQTRHVETMALFIRN
ncbi:23S rRNA (uracil(1939)-C(5))-methyltransferase RlmD [Thalassotalea crassostreae]|uniref:23S rRNA (uracil(1939)-C(5))-methyltransferase RlmD n=1 Tax=Thalassotalea crassostreae TaxID=1763536 RepID=UPI000839006D|nr:23S rRNA (uracil(1939)-C(5))-methyltransferase RlmD [Thalassotalea crassostreae]